MQNPKPTLNYKVKKPLTSQIFIALGTGAAFAGIDAFNYFLHNGFKKFVSQEEKLEIPKDNKQKDASNIEFDRNELTKMIANKSGKPETQSPETSQPNFSTMQNE